MGKLALTVVGMGIGFALGGPFGAQIGAMVGGIAGSLLFPTNTNGPRLTDLSVTASTYGQVIPEVYGTMRIGGNMIWSAGIKEHKKKSSAGKGGPTQTTYTYTCSFAIAYCKGPIDGILRIWADGKLIAGSNPTSGTSGQVLSTSGILNLTSKNKGKFKYRVYNGDEEQLPDSTMEAVEGTGNVPAYRGLAYMIFADMPLEDFGNRVPQITAEITRNPQHFAPYVNFASDSQYPAPTSFSGTADWVDNKFYKLYADPNGTPWFITYDLRTMAELRRVQVQPGENGFMFTDPKIKGAYTDGPYGFNPCFSIGGNYFWDNNSLHNSGTGGIWDVNTGQWLGRIGHMSNGFPQAVQTDTSQPYFPEGAQIGTWGATCMWFRILSVTQGGSTQWDYLWQTGNLGNGGIVFDASRWPVHITTFPFGSGASWTPLRGKEDPGALVTGAPATSDFLLFNNQFIAGTGHDCWMKRLNFVALAEMEYIPGTYTLQNQILNTDECFALPRPVAGQDFQFNNLSYDKSDNSVVFWGTVGADINTGNGGSWCMAKYLIDENTYAWVKTTADLDPSLAAGPYDVGTSVGQPVGNANQSNLDGASIGWLRPTMNYTGAHIYVADLSTGDITANIASPLSTYTSPFAMNAWDDQTNSVLGAPSRIFLTTNSAGVSLQGIVDDILSKTESLVEGVDWDSSALAGITVKGYSIARQCTARDALTQLASAYFFDGVESDYKIKCVLRGGAPVATITEKHLAFVKDKDITLTETRTQELEMPMRITVTYCDFDRDYQDGTQSAKRNSDPFPTMNAHTEVPLQFPICLTASEAKQIADKSLKMAWTNRTNYKMKLPWEFLKYDPTDVINVTMTNGTDYLMRLDKMNLGVDFSIETTAISEAAAAYVSTLTAVTGTIPVKRIAYAGPCDFLMLNTPLLRDADDTQGASSIFYISAKGKSPGDFISANIFEATDTSYSEYDIIDLITVEPTYGTCMNVLPSRFDYAVDYTTVLTVRVDSLQADLTPDVLESCSYDELLAGTKNAAIVGDEIIQFMTATPRSDGYTYDLTGLLRARRGTEYATITHKMGERFVLLQTDGSIKAEYNPSSSWDQPHSFKAVATGDYAENADAFTTTMAPNDLKPYSPTYVRCTDDGTNIHITFERRSRISNELHDADGLLPYKEGQGALAHFVYNVYGNEMLTNDDWDNFSVVPTFSDTVPIYTGVSFTDPLTFQFPRAGLTSFVVEIYEVGYVDGFPKVVQYVNVPGTHEWDKTELY